MRCQPTCSRLIHQRTEGHALFLVDLIRDLEAPRRDCQGRQGRMRAGRRPVGARARVARIGAQHDRAQAWRARKLRPPVAVGGRGARRRFLRGGRRAGSRPGRGSRRRRARPARARPRAGPFRRRAHVPRPHHHAAVPVRARALPRGVDGHAAGHATRRAGRRDRRRARAALGGSHAGDRAGPGGPVRDGAGAAGRRALLQRGRAVGLAAVRAPGGPRPCRTRPCTAGVGARRLGAAWGRARAA